MTYIATSIVLEQYGVHVEQDAYIVPNYLGKCSAPFPVLALDPYVLIPSKVATLALSLLRSCSPRAWAAWAVSTDVARAWVRWSTSLFVQSSPLAQSLQGPPPQWFLRGGTSTWLLPEFCQLWTTRKFGSLFCYFSSQQYYGTNMPILAGLFSSMSVSDFQASTR